MKDQQERIEEAEQAAQVRRLATYVTATELTTAADGITNKFAE